MPTSRRRHYRITESDALSAHERAIAIKGRDGIADMGLVLSAIGRPYNGYYRSLSRKAAALVQSMAGNHGFIDGNKRTTVILTHLLIDRSGYKLVPRRGEDRNKIVEDLVIAVVCHTMDFDDAVAWFGDRLRRK